VIAVTLNFSSLFSTVFTTWRGLGKAQTAETGREYAGNAQPKAEDWNHQPPDCVSYC
jgi:hypothetical protein